MAFSSSITLVDRINRVILGSYIILSALIGIPSTIDAIVGVVVIAQGVMGLCGIPALISSKFKS
ncbi:MAG: hypothetical protein CMF46_01635 [Legionellales bacterium]|nr:hypothetical protein [Legionellales bacterium]|tara:strand:+ start:440 stop:631 length:192 start_codon:yes stop_codon:yes gene_type:complete